MTEGANTMKKTKPQTPRAIKKPKLRKIVVRKKTRHEDDVPELTAADFKKMRPAKEFFTPAQWDGLLKLRGRPKKEKKAQAISIRLDPDVLAHFRAMGRGWQTKINAALRDLIG
jgi:uncharacterized protein (DUF4415 family)